MLSSLQAVFLDVALAHGTVVLLGLACYAVGDDGYLLAFIYRRSMLKRGPPKKDPAVIVLRSTQLGLFLCLVCYEFTSHPPTQDRW